MFTEAEFQEVAELDESYALIREGIQEALRQEEAGEVHEEDVDQTVGHLLTEFADEALDIFDLDVLDDDAITDPEEGEEDDEGEDMAAMSAPTTRGASFGETPRSHSLHFATFAQGFGAATAGLIDQLYETAEDGVADLASVSGLDENTVYGILSGDLIPSIDVADAFATVFPALQEDERAYQEYIQLASDANAEIEPQPVAALSSGVDHELRAEFAQLKERQAIADKFREIERECDRGLNQEWLTPAEFNELMGNFQEREDRVACFSQFCNDQGVDPFNQLDKMDYVLYFLERRGPLTAMFSQLSDGGFESEPLSQEDINSAIEYRSRNGFE